jgi:hypothetical protein
MAFFIDITLYCCINNIIAASFSQLQIDSFSRHDDSH